VNLTKPKFGEPCNGCGKCCAAELCEVADRIFPGAVAPCPALEWRDGRSWCGLITNPIGYINPTFPAEDREPANDILRPQFLRVIPIGQGCGMEDEA
jgi:hypothetical protein